MMCLRVKVIRVDHDGFNGREHPPEEAHVGWWGTITSIELVPDEDHASDNSMDDRRRNVPAYAALMQGYQVFHVMLDNSVGVELMGHEFELMSAVHDGDL